jgi:hypothetical protein
MIFLQDGTSPHIGNVLQSLNVQFLCKWMCQREQISWPSHLLSVCSVNFILGDDVTTKLKEKIRSIRDVSKFQDTKIWHVEIIRSTVDFMDWPHSGAVMHYSGYMEPRDGAVSILLSSQQEAVACMQCIQKESRCCQG